MVTQKPVTAVLGEVIVRHSFGFVMSSVLLVHNSLFSASWAGLPRVEGGIQHRCTEEFPSPRSRTTIAIGETVELWIDQSTPKDPDLSGVRIWSVSRGEGSVYPLVGSSTMLTADLAEDENTIVVEALLNDAADDAQPIKKTLTFEVLVPGGA